MIVSKPPRTDKQDLNNFLTEVQRELNSRIKSLFIPVDTPSGTHGTHSIDTLLALGSTNFEFVVPYDVLKIREASVRYIPTTTGTFDYTFLITEGAVGADEQANTATVTADAVAATDDQIGEVLVTDAFASVDAGDQVGCKFTVDVLTTTTEILVLGLLIKYT